MINMERIIFNVYMCGINGIVKFSGRVQEGQRIVRSMNQIIAHRGPDGEGIFTSKKGRVVLGHRLLSIVDIENGLQPMTVEHRGFTYSVTYNGEIYNHKDIRTELELRGHELRTNSDTEVLIRSYIEWGKQCLGMFNGMFAFAIYDGKHEQVFLARDRLGIKPLFWQVLCLPTAACPWIDLFSEA